MAMKNSFKPTERTITTAQVPAKKNPYAERAITAALWNLVLLQGTAKLSTTAVLASGAVVLWSAGNTATSVEGADIITFTDSTGYYAVTLKTGVSYKVKLYS